MSIGRVSGGIVFLHGLRHNNDRRSFNVRITGVTNVPGDVIGHTGSVLRRLRASGHRRNVTGPATRVTSNQDKVRLDFFRLSSPMLDRVQSRVLGLSIGGLAPLRTLGGLGSVGGVMGNGWVPSFFVGHWLLAVGRCRRALAGLVSINLISIYFNRKGVSRDGSHPTEIRKKG